MELYRFQLLIGLMMICLKLQIDCKYIKNISRFKMNSTSIMTGGLLLTMHDKIILIYPKEFGYERDYKQTIYNINNLKNPSHDIVIRDSIYDRRTYSIYSLITSKSGSQIICLTFLGQHNNKQQQPLENNYQKEEYDFEIASNWSISTIYRNSSQLTSLDINVKKRRLYWFETINSEWSFVIKSLKNLNKTPKFYTFNDYLQFSLSRYFTIAYDNGNNTNDIVFFTSDSILLNICFLVNRTCQNYFKSPFFNRSIIVESKSNEISESEFILNQIEPEDKDDKENYKFSILLNLNYNKNDHSLLLSDFGSGKIKRIYFANKTNVNFTFMKMDTIAKSILGKSIMPSAGLIHKGSLFWAEFTSVRSNVMNRPCGRLILPILKPMNLRKF